MIVESSCDVVHLRLGGSGHWSHWTVSILHLTASFCLIFPPTIKDTGTKAVWLAGKVMGAAEMAEECCPSCPALGSSAWPPRITTCEDAISIKSATERTIKVDITVDLVKEHLASSCHFFLKLKPYWNQPLNFSCCDIARPEECAMMINVFYVSCSEGQAEILCCTVLLTLRIDAEEVSVTCLHWCRLRFSLIKGQQHQLAIMRWHQPADISGTLWTLDTSKVKVKDFHTDVKLAESVLKVKVIRDFVPWLLDHKSCPTDNCKAWWTQIHSILGILRLRGLSQPKPAR